MWSLVYAGNSTTASSSTERLKPDVRLLCGAEYIVGRKAADVILADDASISRRHAVLSVTHDEQKLSSPTYTPILSISDCSKFGTWVNDNKLSGGSCSLAHRDVIQFGQLQSTYRAEYKPLRVVVSSLASADKVKLKECLLQLGGHLVTDNNAEFDLLVMGKVGMTVKAVCALASLKPIVTIDYITSLLAAVQNKDSLPSTESFTPQLAEENLGKDLLISNRARQSLFKGMSFFFCSKSQFERMKMAVHLAGGTALLLESKPRSLTELTTAGSILMYCDARHQPDWYKDCSAYLTRKHMRYIQDAEIGHAVLYCSTERHCNPQQDAGSKLHEEFSQKVRNSQFVTQSIAESATSTRHSMAPPSKAQNTSTSLLVPDSQVSKCPRLGERSLHVADILPSPDVTSVPETQKSMLVVNRQIKVERQPSNKRKETLSPPAGEKRIKMLVTTPLVEQCSALDRETLGETLPQVEMSTACMSVEGNSVAPSLHDVDTPSKTHDLSTLHSQESGCDVSVVDETQCSRNSDKPVEDLVAIKSEVTDRVPCSDGLQHHPEAGDLTDERKVEVGEFWDRMQVEYRCLLRKSRPPVFGKQDPNERDGLTLWKGKWLPNFKKFKKCGRRDPAHLPTIIGGGDLVDGLCSQPDTQEDFIRMPAQETARHEVTAPQLVPKRNTIKSSIFGGHWDLPTKR